MILSFLKKNYLVILTFFIALFLRTYNLEKTLTFLEDEGRDALIAYRMIDTMRPVLLGPQTSTGDMYLGPFYYYFITPALAVANLSPLGPAALIALTGSVTSVLMFLIGKKWFGPTAGLVAAILYSVMPLPVVFTRNSWNPNLLPLVSLILIYLTITLTTQKKLSKTWSWLYFGVGISAGILVQLHYMALIFLGTIALILLLYHYRNYMGLLRGVALGLFGFLLMLAPFIVFEIRNDFVNIRAITRFVEADEVKNIRYTMPVSLWADKVGSTTVRLTSSLFGRDALTPDPYRTPLTLTVLGAIVLLLLTLARGTGPSSHYLRVLSLMFFIPLLSLGIYQENIHLHYLGFLFPLLYLLFAAGFVHPRLRYLFAPILLTSLFYALPQLYSYLSSAGTNQLVRAREVAQYITTDSNNNPYNLVSSPVTNTTPYQYYAAISTNPPVRSLEKTVYLVCQGSACSKEDINSIFLFITGPAHPTLEAYLGHPLFHTFDTPRTVVSNDHVSHGVWVAKILLE